MYMTKVTIKYSRKINLGNYSSIDLSMMPTITFDADDDIDGILHEAWAMCRANIEHAAAPILEGYKVGELHGITEQELFLGLPIETMEVVENADQESD